MNNIGLKADKSDTVKETRKQVYKEAQDKRVKEGDAEAEAQAIKKYWATFQDPKTPYHTNEMWEAYKKEHRDPLNELFKNFLILLLKNKDKENWNIDGIGKFISPENAEKYLGKTPVDALLSKNGFNVNPQAISSDIDADANYLVGLLELKAFEEKVLFNLYKEQQKHEFDYFFYEKGE